MSEPSVPLLSLESIRHRYGDNEVLRGIDLRMAPGEVLCLLGPSGCGKTTLLRLAAGIESVQGGRVALQGRVVGDAQTAVHVPPEQRRVGMMFQDFALFPHLTVRRNILFGVRPVTREREEWLAQVTARMHVSTLLDAFPGTLSGGQQQRVALLRALAPGPNLLLLDEPFSGLDVNLRAVVREQTLALLRESGVAVLMVTHDPNEAMFMADRIAVMREGSIEQVGDPDGIYFRPQTPFVARLFGRVNEIEGIVRDEQVATPFGAVAAPGRPDGARVTVYVRPDAIVPAPGDGIPAEVISAGRLGAEIEVALRLARQPSGPGEQTVVARWHASSLPRRGDAMPLILDRAAGVFVFEG